MAWRVASLLLLAAAALPAQAGKLYCCEVNGQKVCGDILPAQCQVKGYKELNAQGVAVREVAPPLTAEQRAQKEAEERRQKEEEAAQKEQKRKDQALLNTYSSEKDIDQLKARAEQEFLALIRQGEGKVADAAKRLDKLKGELEFYKNRAVPPELDKNIKDTEFDLRSQKDAVERRKQELEQVRAKYDKDKVRYIDLTRGKSANSGNLHPALMHPPAPAAPTSNDRPR